MGSETTPAVTGLDETVVENMLDDVHATDSQKPSAQAESLAKPQRVPVQPEWLAPSEPPARGEARRDKALLDLLPVGILIYRLDRLLYANPAFLTQMGYPSLHALEDAGGLDALYVEPGVSNAPSTSDTGTPVMISASQPQNANSRGKRTDTAGATDARLYTISWDGDSALALIFSGARNEARPSRPRSRSQLRLQSRRLPNRWSPNRCRPATPTPKNSAPSSTPRPKAS